MNLRCELIFPSVLIFVSLWVSCSSDPSQSKNHEVGPTGTPFVSSSDASITKFINVAGWHVPMPQRMKKGPENTLHSKSVDGSEILVTATTMVGFREYRFTQGAQELVRNGYPDLGELRLVALKQLSVSGKIFSYVIMAESLKQETSSMVGNAHSRRPFYYKILDSDGDGKFETLYPGNSDNIVPGWVSNSEFEWRA